MEEANKALECFPSLQSAHGGPPGNEQAWAYNYFDIKPLHCIWEPVWLGGGSIGEPIQYPEIDERYLITFAFGYIGIQTPIEYDKIYD